MNIDKNDINKYNIDKKYCYEWLFKSFKEKEITTVYTLVKSKTLLIFILAGLRYINPCRLFDIKSCLYIYIKYIWFVNEQFVGNNF